MGKPRKVRPLVLVQHPVNMRFWARELGWRFGLDQDEKMKVSPKTVIFLDVVFE